MISAMTRSVSKRTGNNFLSLCFRPRSALALLALALSPPPRVQCFSAAKSFSASARPSAGGSLKNSNSINTAAKTTAALPDDRSPPFGVLRRNNRATFATTRLSSSSTASVETEEEQETSPGGMIDLGSKTPSEKLEELRARMKELDLDVWLIPTDDPHLSEYVPDAYKRREFMTGFKGSAGTAVVTADDALLWTDSRYWNEAGLQLDAECWTLQKSGIPATPTIPKWLGDLAAEFYQNHDKKPLRVGMDPYVHAASFAKDLKTAFEDAANEAGLMVETADGDDNAEEKTAEIGVLDTSNTNLVDPIWGDIRPPVPASPFRVHPLEYAGMSLQDKIAKVREEMKTKKATLAVFCTLDDVAYFMNLRCKGDIDTCPVGIAYCTVSAEDEVTLYCDPRKVEDAQVQEHLKDLVTVQPYDAIVPDIAKHCETKGNKVWLDTSRANYALSNTIPKRALVDSQNAVTPLKACKNDAEIKGMRQAHIVDGAAMAKFMAWLENTIVNEGRSVSEVEIDERLTACRAEQPGFTEVSFPTIAGVGSNGAIIHYRAQEGSDLLKYLDADTPILIDSGGQYTYGTTDVTRTWYFGTSPSEEFVNCYTRVLKGNIGLDQMIFPENTPGFVVDVYARRWLWDAGLDYGHGTGHGVGAALNVHEGPMSISPRWTNKEVLKKGMVVSNEPGYYEDGGFGIRIENLIEIRYVKPEHNEETGESKDDEAAKDGKKKFLKFEKLTQIPIQKNLINLDLMTDGELDWLDAYHAEVFEKVSPLLQPDSPAMAWLTKMCEKIDRKGR